MPIHPFRWTGQGRRAVNLLSVPISLAAFASVTLLLAASSAWAAAPKVGEPAPPFEFQGVDGERHSSAELYGETGVVVAWFPKAFTPG